MNHTKEEKFEGSGVIVEVSRETHCIIKIKATLNPEAVAKCYKKAIKQINKSISIPGFRKGKVPDSSVLERYPAQVEQEFKEAVIQEAFEQGLSLSNIYPIRKESITPPKIVHCSKEEGAEITFSFEISPVIPTIDFTKIELSNVEKSAVDEKRVTEIVEQIRKGHADYQEEKERAAQEGDYVELTLYSVGTEGEKQPIVQKRRFEVGAEMQHWLKELVIGMHTGQTKEGAMTPPPHASEEEKKQFTGMRIEVEVVAIYSITLPELDDELAQKVGAKTKEEVLEKIRHNLDQQALSDQKSKQIEKIEEELLRIYPIELPSTLVLEEKKERIKARLDGLRRMKLTDEQILARQKEIESEIHDEVIRAIRLYFINQQIAKQGNVDVSREELNLLLQEEAIKNPHLYQENIDRATVESRVKQLRAAAYQRKIEEFALAEVLKLNQ